MRPEVLPLHRLVVPLCLTELFGEIKIQNIKCDLSHQKVR